MGRAEAIVGTRLQQFPASEGKSSVADITPIKKLRPGSADIVEGQKVRVPGSRVCDEAVPLDKQAMLRLDILVQPLEDEERIIASRPEAINRHDMDQGIDASDVKIGKQEALGKIDLLKTSRKSVDRRLHVHGGSGAERDRGK